jgi:hypothetical protein
MYFCSALHINVRWVSSFWVQRLRCLIIIDEDVDYQEEEPLKHLDCNKAEHRLELNQ